MITNKTVLGIGIPLKSYYEILNKWDTLEMMSFEFPFIYGDRSIFWNPNCLKCQTCRRILLKLLPEDYELPDFSQYNESSPSRIYTETPIISTFSSFKSFVKFWFKDYSHIKDEYSRNLLELLRGLVLILFVFIILLIFS